MPSKLTRTLCAALLLTLLSACGQRGPLTLPDKKKHTAPAPAAGTPATQADDDKKKPDDTKP